MTLYANYEYFRRKLEDAVILGTSGMRKPKHPPNANQLWERLSADPDRIKAVVQASATAEGDGKYHHWDKLRHYSAPGDLSVDEWWLALKLARWRLRKEIPLADVGGRRFWYGLPDPASEHLHYLATNAAGQLQADQRPVIDPAMRDRYVIRSLVEESITSSQIEGAATTRRVAKQMLRSRRPPKDTGERMILNNYLAMNYIRDIKSQPLTKQLILDLHRMLTEGTLDDPSAAGRLRRSEESIHVYDIRDNEVLHTPPSAEELPSRLEAMCAFANGETPDYFLDPVVRAIILHFWLAYEHPFVDGNGRCARALFYWSILRQGYWLFEFISISSVINKAYTKYERTFLYTESDENDLTYFILYHLEVIRKGVDELKAYLSRKTREVRRIENIVRTSARFNHRQLALLSHALRHSDAEYTVNSHQRSHGVVHQTARTDLYDLEERGLLRKRRIGRTYYFSPVSEFEERLEKLR